MANPSYIVGNTIRLLGTFTDPTLDPANPEFYVDPQTVTFKVRSPKGATTSYSGVRDAQGRYHADVNVNDVGEWVWGAYGSGLVAAAGESSFHAVTSFD